MTELAPPQISSLMEALPGIAAVLRSPVATAIVSLSRAAAGLEPFQIAQAEELLKYGVRRTLLAQKEVDDVMLELREVAAKLPKPVPEKPAKEMAKAAVVAPPVAKVPPKPAPPAKVTPPAKVAPVKPTPVAKAAPAKPAPAKVAPKPPVPVKAAAKPAAKPAVKSAPPAKKPVAPVKKVVKKVAPPPKKAAPVKPAKKAAKR